MAFPGLTTNYGRRRLEMYFFAKSLLLAKQHSGILSIFLPISFAEGDVFQQYRKILCDNYYVEKAIEVPENVFACTETRTILLIIRMDRPHITKTNISRINPITFKLESLSNEHMTNGTRLDARFHQNDCWKNINIPNISQLGATITRGSLSNSEARKRSLPIVHTSDLGRILNGTPPQFSKIKNKDIITVKSGDILLSRTGKRVCWQPVIVQQGSFAITDHVFRIRVPKKNLNSVIDSFKHPAFFEWLNNNIKGVCASVLTKKDLQTMPVFSALTS